MSKLFIYYSLSGNGDIIADLLNQNGYDIRKVTPKKKLKNNFFGIFRGGFYAGLNKKFKLVDYDNNVSNYDEIVIGSPIWNSKFSCPINTVLNVTDLSNKKISFILYSGSGEATKALDKINDNYKNAKVVILKEPKKHNEELKKLEEFINEKR